LVGLFVILLVATPLVFTGWLVNRVLQHRLRVAEIRAHRRLALPPPGGSEIEARVRNLEDIVCSLDFELAAKLRQVSEPVAGA
jgi:hypothetical protein